MWEHVSVNVLVRDWVQIFSFQPEVKAHIQAPMQAQVVVERLLMTLVAQSLLISFADFAYHMLAVGLECHRPNQKSLLQIPHHLGTRIARGFLCCYRRMRS